MTKILTAKKIAKLEDTWSTCCKEKSSEKYMQFLGAALFRPTNLA
jgi:hypothetical protein